MATVGTLRSERYARLVRAHGDGVQVLAQPCPGLADLIEQGHLDDDVLAARIAELTRPIRDAEADTVVLGCTHYAFVRHHIQAAMGADVQIIDTADAVARHAVTRLDSIIERGASAALPHLQTTGDAERLRAIAAAWLPFACTVESIGADHAPRTS